MSISRVVLAIGGFGFAARNGISKERLSVVWAILRLRNPEPLHQGDAPLGAARKSSSIADTTQTLILFRAAGGAARPRDDPPGQPSLVSRQTQPPAGLVGSSELLGGLLDRRTYRVRYASFL